MLLIALATALTASTADTVRYEVSFPNAVHHEAEVTATWRTRPRAALEVRMSRASPGRYALHEFAKNVYGVAAVDSKGHALRITRNDPYAWHVTAGADGVVRFSYTLFADRADGTYSQFDLTHAHMSMPATFAWAVGYDHSPIAVHFTVPDGLGWKPATQLKPTRDPWSFTAVDLQYFMDSPTELSDYTLRTWTIPGPHGRVDTMRAAIHHLGTEAEVDDYVGMMKQVVAQEVAIYGETARYDHGTYTFIIDYLPWASGDGMEHRNSTVISSSASLARARMALLGTVAHEFFHSWNMERIRSKQIEPFKFFEADPSNALWFGEGFTSYFDALSIRRAGLMTDSAYAAGIARNVNAVTNTPGRRFFGPMEMSQQAPFVDAATAIDPTNRGNTFLSYYTYGAALGLGLDLSLRQRFAGKDLNGFMRTMWEHFGAPDRRYVIKRPYTVDDLEHTLGSYTGDTAWAHRFFTQYVHGREIVDYPALLAQAGFRLRYADSTTAWAGPAAFHYDTSGATLFQNTIVGSPLYEAGIENGDKLVSIDGMAPTGESQWQAIIAAHKPGDRVAFTYVTRGGQKNGTLTFGTSPALLIETYEQAGLPVSDAQKAFREQWLGSLTR